MRATRYAVLLTMAGSLAWGCKKRGPEPRTAEDPRQFRETALKLESCSPDDGDAQNVDSNADGVPEIVRIRSGETELCRAMDLNFDGKMDRTVFFEKSGKLRRTESDFDRDGSVDEIALYDSGVVREKHRVTTMDGKIDTWEFFETGRLVRTERDENGDGVIDQWWEYPKRGCPLIHVDVDGDGRPDPGASIDYCKETGYVPPPIDGEADSPPKGANLGKKDEGVDEVSNLSADEATESDADGAEELEGTDDASAEGAP